MQLASRVFNQTYFQDGQVQYIRPRARPSNGNYVYMSIGIYFLW